jgi:hypothetical protein
MAGSRIMRALMRALVLELARGAQLYREPQTSIMERLKTKKFTVEIRCSAGVKHGRVSLACV